MWWADHRFGATVAMVIGAPFAGAALGLILIVAVHISDEPAPVLRITATPVAVADLTGAPAPELTPTLPRPTPAPAVIPEPTSTLPEPPVRQSELVTVGAPAPLALDYADWYIVVLAFPPAEQYRAARTSWCESEFTDDVIGRAGEVGRFQIHPIWFEDEEVQAIIESWFPGATQSVDGIVAALKHEHVNAAVAANIQGRYGWGPWTTRYGCAGWQG